MSRSEPRPLVVVLCAVAWSGVFTLWTPASAFTPGNLLVATSTGVFSPLTPVITEWTPVGAVVQSLLVPQPGDDGVRDLVVDEGGRVQVFNGHFDPWLSTYDPLTSTWSAHTYDGWSIANNGSYGGIAALGPWIFVTDHETGGLGDAPRGIIRFNRHDFSAERFATNEEPVDLNIGLDGFLYAIRPTGSPGGLRLDVIEPASMTLVRTLTFPYLSSGYRAVAADATGRIFVAGFSGQLLRLSPSGVVEKSTTTTAIGLGSQTLGDLDIDPSGRIALGTRFGAVLITDSEFNPANSSMFSTPDGQQTFVTWVASGPVPVQKRSWGALKALYR